MEVSPVDQQIFNGFFDVLFLLRFLQNNDGFHIFDTVPWLSMQTLPNMHVLKDISINLRVIRTLIIYTRTMPAATVQFIAIQFIIMMELLSQIWHGVRTLLHLSYN